jgi:hypothetical protein
MPLLSFCYLATHIGGVRKTRRDTKKEIAKQSVTDFGQNH